MPMRFRKSIKLGGAKININKKSVGVTGGVRGAHITANSRGGVTKSAGIPGTGISFRSSSGGSQSATGGCLACIKWLLILCAAYLIIVYAWIPVIIAGIAYFIYCKKTETSINKKYVIIGAIIFAVSVAAFVNYLSANSKTPVQSATVSSQISLASK